MHNNTAKKYRARCTELEHHLGKRRSILKADKTRLLILWARVKEGQPQPGCTGAVGVARLTEMALTEMFEVITQLDSLDNVRVDPIVPLQPGNVAGRVVQ